MAELEWLDGYTGQSVDELIALEGKYRIDSLVLAFEQALDQKWARDGEKMTDEEFVVLAVEAMEREVNNSGWGQFFVNTAQFAPVIVDALQRIRCPKTAKIAEMAVKIVEKAPITEQEIENCTWEENEKRQEGLNACDNLYSEHPENIAESLFAFIKANRAKIEP
jgi:proline dehydrogenase